MSESEERVARRRVGKGRLEAFSDGVLAIAITLRVPDLVIPENAETSRNLWQAIVDEWPGYLGYLVSFSTIGALWIGHSALSDYLDHVDPVFVRFNLVFLLFVGVLPFTTRLLSEFHSTGAESTASTVYGLTLLLCSLLLSGLWRYALAAGLVRDDADATEIAVISRRLTPGLGAYAALIILGLFFPNAAVVGYLVVAVLQLVPVRRPRPERGRGGREGH